MSHDADVPYATQPHWALAAPVTPSTPAMPTSVKRAVLGLVITSLIFLAFAGGMVVQRFVVSEDAKAASEGAPETFDQAWELVQTRYVDQNAVNEEEMLEAAIDAMLLTLEDEGHTRYMTAEEAHAQSESLQGEYVGVGIQVDQKDGNIVVVAPIDNSPAQEAGIKAGDVLIAVDGQSIVGQSIDDVVGKVRGEEGTQVTLRFTREGESDPLNVTLTRRKIEVSAVAWTMLDGDIADIRLTQFSSGAGDDLQRALEEVRAAGAKAIILDLRNNPGGYINEALQIGSTFVPEGETIFITQVRDGTQEEHLATAQAAHIGDTPLVVLINEGSASSSEIVAGAVKANNPNATVIGETTFGTGTVLSNFGLEDGSSLLLGTELWLTPEGKLIKNEGVRPDVVVGLPEGQFPFTPIDNAANDISEIEDAQLEWAIHVIESGQAGEDHPTNGTSGPRVQ